MKLLFSADKKYLAVGLCSGDDKTRRLVHKLVLEAFIGPRPTGFHACHNDGNGKNNSVTNLRWDTAKGNNADKKKHGTSQDCERNGRAVASVDSVRSVVRDILSGRKLKTSAVAKNLGISWVAADCIIKRKHWLRIWEEEESKMVVEAFLSA